MTCLFGANWRSTPPPPQEQQQNCNTNARKKKKDQTIEYFDQASRTTPSLWRADVLHALNSVV